MKSEERIPLIEAPNSTVKPVEHEHTFTWSNISVSRPQKRTIMERIRRVPEKPPRVILQDMFGIARPGEILAIMGASGVGKTTLLNVLIGYEDPSANISQGAVCLNGIATTRSQRLNGSLIGLVEQHELYVETMLLEEHLIFQAMLRMPREIKDNDRRLRVKSVITLLALDKCARTIINRLSGGERKRLALATVLLANPPVILIDEPTSGLDAYLAKQAMYIIRALATEQRHSLVVVLHQPTSEMYGLMDSIAVITHGGRLSFFGPRKDAAGFFETECKLQGTSLDNFIEKLAVPPETEEIARQSLMVADCYAQSEFAQTTLNEISKLSVGVNPNEKSRFPQEQWNSSRWRQFKWLLWRSFMSGARDPVRTVNVLLRCIIPAILFGLMYFHLQVNSRYKQNIESVSFATLSITLNSCASIVLGTLPADVPVYVKETRRRIYQTIPYYAIVLLRDLPLMISLPVGFTTVVYWLADISNNFVHYVEFVAIITLVCNATAAVAAFISSFSSDIENAVATSVPVLQIFNIFSGFFFYLPSLPRFFIFIPYIAPVYYGFTSLHELETMWLPSNSTTTQCPRPDYGVRSDFTLAADLWCEDRDKYESQYDSNLVIFNVIMLFVLCFVYNALAFLTIWFRGNRNRIADFFYRKKFFKK